MQQKFQKVCIQSGCEQTCFVHIDSNIDEVIHTHHNHSVLPRQQVLQIIKNLTSNTLIAQEIQNATTTVNKIKYALDQILDNYIEKLANGRFRNIINGRQALILQKITTPQESDELTGDDLSRLIDLTKNKKSSLFEQIGTQVDTQNIGQLLCNIQKQLENYQQRNRAFAWRCFIKGWDSYQILDFDDTIECYDRAINLNPNQWNFYFQRAFVHHQQGQLQIAKTNYKQSLLLNPNHSNSLNNLGMIQSKQGNYLAAFQLYSQAITADPKDPINYHNRGYINFKQHKYRDALTDITKSIQLEPSKDSYYFRSQIYKKLGKVQESERDAIAASRL